MRDVRQGISRRLSMSRVKNEKQLSPALSHWRLNKDKQTTNLRSTQICQHRGVKALRLAFCLPDLRRKRGENPEITKKMSTPTKPPGRREGFMWWTTTMITATARNPSTSFLWPAHGLPRRQTVMPAQHSAKFKAASTRSN